MGDGSMWNKRTDIMGSKGPYREIITKAVCGTAKKNLVYTKFIKINEKHVPDKVLGTSINNFELLPVAAEPLSHKQTGVSISGSFEVNIWYSYDSDRFTDLSRETVKFTEVIALEDFDGQSLNELDARAMLIKTPQCKAASLQNNNTVRVEIELGIYAEVVGETKIRVRVYSEEGNEDS
ncbi:outer spore coat protein CotE [Desulfolucanica intricata]|uniref:outer spore coat protein CotE n=1 Tax=Desulfolucanica intricata TaxID=1285191 RepID=UPI0008340EB5|nr:outer spore coat protein CotE [Desulfolucanica intricata]